MMKEMLREPLVHFLLIGAALFGLSAWWGGGGESSSAGSSTATAPASPSRKVVVAEREIASLLETWTRVWQRPPTPQEVRGIVEDRVREEVLYREALAMGLEADDLIIRRRLRQKMEYFIDGLAETTEPTEEQLRAYLEKNAASYREPGRTSFRQVFFNAERRGEAAADDARAALERLRDPADAPDPAELGDPFLLERAYRSVSDDQITGLMGGEFTEALAAIEPGAWAGPVRSVYGFHVIYVDERTASRERPFEEVAEAVRRDWMSEHRRAFRERFMQKLLAEYEIAVEPIPEYADERTDGSPATNRPSEAGR